MIIKPASTFVRAIGIDTVAAITSPQATSLAKHGIAFVVRYLGGISVAEVGTILSAGLALMTVGYSRAPGWTPSAALGSSDGTAAVAHMAGLGLPEGLTVWCDLEGMGGTA